jgi:hypothetical protein
LFREIAPGCFAIIAPTSKPRKRGRDIIQEITRPSFYEPPPASLSRAEHPEPDLPAVVVAIDLNNVLTRMAEYQIERSSRGEASSDGQNLIKQLEFFNTKWKKLRSGPNIDKWERLEVLWPCNDFKELCTSLQRLMERPLEWMHDESSESGPWKDLDPLQVRAVYIKDPARSEKEVYDKLRESGYGVEVLREVQKVDPFPPPKTTNQNLVKDEVTRLSSSPKLEVTRKPAFEDVAASVTLAPTSQATLGVGPTLEASRKENSAALKVSTSSFVERHIRPLRLPIYLRLYGVEPLIWCKFFLG